VVSVEVDIEAFDGLLKFFLGGGAIDVGHGKVTAGGRT